MAEGTNIVSYDTKKTTGIAAALDLPRFLVAGSPKVITHGAMIACSMEC